MEIRTIEPRDFVEVATLENENWTIVSTPIKLVSNAEIIANRILQGMNYFLAINDDSKILGVLNYGPRHNTDTAAHVMTFGIMTVKKARRQGVSSALINFFFDFARKNEIKKITIEVLSTNSAAILLYEKLGFVCEGKQKAEFYLNNQYVDNLFYAYFLEEI